MCIFYIETSVSIIETMISTNYFILTKNIGYKFYTYNLEIGFVEIQEPFRQTVLKTHVLLRYLSNFFSSTGEKIIVIKTI